MSVQRTSQRIRISNSFFSFCLWDIKYFVWLENEYLPSKGWSDSGKLTIKRYIRQMMDR